MNSTDLLPLKNYLRAVISGSETIESLWATCLKTTKEMNLDYFSYHIQHPPLLQTPKCILTTTILLTEQHDKYE